MCLTHDGVASGIGQDLVAESGDNPEVLPMQISHAVHELPGLTDGRLVQHVRESAQPPELLVLPGQGHEEGAALVLIPETRSHQDLSLALYYHT